MSKEPGSFVRSYLGSVKRRKVIIICVWAVLLVVGVIFGPRLLSAATLTVSPPKGSDAAKAQALLREEFPEQADTSPIICLLKHSHNNSVLTEATKNFTFALNSSVAAYGEDLVGSNGFLSYYTLMAMGSSFKPLAETTVCQEKSCNGSETIIMIQVNAGSADIANSRTTAFTKYIKKEVSAIAETTIAHEGITARLTGTLVFGLEIAKGTERDLLLMDGITFPIALATLAYVLRSGRLLILPVLSMILSILTSFLIMYPVALNYDVISFTPSIMMSGTIALSIDYSLFLLSRFREELLRGRSVEDAVLYMLWTAGHTIAVSGTTLAVCFFGLMFFPVSILRSPGLGAGLAILTVLVCNLTLTPSLLLLFPNFFRRAIKPKFCGGEEYNVESANDEKMALLSANADIVEREHAEVSKGLWYRFGNKILNTWPSIIIVVVVLGLAVPCGLRGVDFKRSSSIVNIAPRTAAATKAYNDMSISFGAGKLFPYDILVVPKTRGSSVMNDETFTQSQEAIALLATVKPVNSTTFQSIVYLDGINVPYAFIEQQLKTCNTNPNQIACVARETYVNANETALYISAQVNFDPFSTQGVQWLASARQALANMSATSNVTFTIANGATISNDMEQKVYDLFPTAVGITTAFVFVLVGAAFYSFAIPLRAIITIAETLAFVYGAAVWVYQYGILDGLHIPGLSGSLHALSWISPVMAFSVLVGLGLDYDVFLLSRVVEYRREGFSDRDSILLGLARTGRIITAAGLIMAIAFVGLLFTSAAVLNQLSFYLVLSVLIDTFIIRSCVVPCLMYLIGRLNWWPSRMPHSVEG